MEQYAERAIKELKRSGDWDAHEERINYDYDHDPKRSPPRTLLLVILRGETPEIIPIRLELAKRSNAHAYVEEIKRQLLDYFASATHRTHELPNAFTVREVLKRYPEISDWFYQT